MTVDRRPRLLRPEARVGPLSRVLAGTGITKRALAAYAGCDPTTLRNIDAGRSSVYVGTLIRVAVALGVAPVELWPELAATPRRGGLIHLRSDLRRQAIGRAQLAHGGEPLEDSTG